MCFQVLLLHAYIGYTSFELLNSLLFISYMDFDNLIYSVETSGIYLFIKCSKLLKIFTFLPFDHAGNDFLFDLAVIGATEDTEIA